MQYAANGLPRIILPRTRVNKGNKQTHRLLWVTAVCLSFERFPYQGVKVKRAKWVCLMTLLLVRTSLNPHLGEDHAGIEGR